MISEIANKKSVILIQNAFPTLEKYIDHIHPENGATVIDKIKEKGTYAKMARGSLVRYMAEHQIENPEEIKQFDELGYKYKEEYSNSTKYCYLIH